MLLKFVKANKQLLEKCEKQENIGYNFKQIENNNNSVEKW